MKSMYGKSGFTLIELMVTVTVAAILLSMAVPAFTNFIKDSQLLADSNSLVADVNLARSEAIKRGVPVGVCSSPSPNAGSPTCAASATWTSGWILFVDANGNSAFDNGETLLKAGQAASAKVGIISNLNVVQYRADGSISGGSVAVFATCDDRGAASGSQFQINILGRPRTITDSNPSSCSAPSVL